VTLHKATSRPWSSLARPEVPVAVGTPESLPPAPVSTNVTRWIEMETIIIILFVISACANIFVTGWFVTKISAITGDGTRPKLLRVHGMSCRNCKESWMISRDGGISYHCIECGKSSYSPGIGNSQPHESVGS